MTHVEILTPGLTDDVVTVYKLDLPLMFKTGEQKTDSSQ